MRGEHDEKSGPVVWSFTASGLGGRCARSDRLSGIRAKSCRGKRLDEHTTPRARTTVIDGVNEDSGVLADKDADGNRQYFWTDPWDAAQTRMMVACRAYGLRPIDGPFGDFNDPEGYIAAANRAAVSGFKGKWAIHPSQIELANQVYTPSEAEVTKARRIVDAMA